MKDIDIEEPTKIIEEASDLWGTDLAFVRRLEHCQIGSSWPFVDPLNNELSDYHYQEIAIVDIMVSQMRIMGVWIDQHHLDSIINFLGLHHFLQILVGDHRIVERANQDIVDA